MREMRRSEKAMSVEGTKALLERAEYGILSTVGEDNIPYGVPMSFAYTGEAIYLHCAVEGRRLENIGNNNNVCFTAVDSVELMPQKFNTKYKSTMVFGKISVVEDAAEKKAGIIEIVKKYSSEYYEEGLAYIESAFDNMKVLKIEIDDMTGKATL